MLSRKERKRPVAEINVVPYIDVMLVLLVIFMITAPLLTQGVKVALPEVASQPIDNHGTEPIIVSIDQTGHYYLNIASHPEQALTENDLSLQIANALNQSKDRNVLVKGDKQVDYGKVVNAMALLQKAGAHQVGLMTEPR